MDDEQLRDELLARKGKAKQEAKFWNGQVEACDALLSALPDGVRPQTAPATEAVASCIERALLAMPDTYSVREILAEVNSYFPADQQPPKETITSAFWKLAQERGLKIKEKGVGRRPTIYTKG